MLRCRPKSVLDSDGIFLKFSFLRSKPKYEISFLPSFLPLNGYSAYRQ